MKLNVLAGLPRSGSTLLANVLSQHPDVYVSGTSALPNAVEAVMNVLTSSPEVTAELANVPGSYERYLTSLRGLCEGWYSHREEQFIFDKGRGWATARDILSQLYPDSVMIMCVRDPRDVVASIERQNRRTAAFHSPIARTLHESADILMRKDGMVGGPMRFAEDLLRSQRPGVVWVPYEAFVANPVAVLAKIQLAVGCEPHDYDLDNVENVSSDLDALYRNKYPHEGSGAVKPAGRHWSELIDAELGRLIAGVFPYFMRTFGYGP